MSDGWVRNWRKIEEWEWYTKPNMAHLFQHLIRRANHRRKAWQGKVLEPGQLIMSQENLSLETGLSRQTVRTGLNHLKSTGEITIQSTNAYTLITICKYNTYQAYGDTGNQPTNQPPNQRLTSEQPTANQQLTTNKNDKNEKNEKKKTVYSVDFEKFWAAYPRKEGKGKAWESWLKKKPPIEQVLATLEKYKRCDQWLKDNGQFIPHPATWLNQERWEDEIKGSETLEEKMARMKREGRWKDTL